MKSRWIFTIFALGFLCILFSGEKVKAEETRQVVKQEGVLRCINNGEQENHCYVAVMQDKNGFKIVKPCTNNSKIYYFNKKGVGTEYKKTGFIPITFDGSKKTYYAQKGNLVTNQIVGSKKTGYFYVDTTGVKITDKTVGYAVKFVKAHTKSSDSNQTKLKKCYDYLWKHYKYKRIYATPDSRALNPKAQDMSKIATEMFKYKQGNCHRYAACFAYIARVLGYDSKVVVGRISSSRGMTPHGWTLVSYNKTGKKYNWYLCDPDMELHNTHVYMSASHSCRTEQKWICTLTIKNGKVKWK